MPFDLSPAISTPVANALRKARDYLSDPAHWCQGHYSRGDAYCVVGSLKLREPHFWAHNKATSIFREVVGSSLEDWNDAPGRTHAEVLAAFDRAIALAEQRGM